MRTVYYISDGTGLSAATLGHSLMTQFESISFESFTLPYIDTKEKAREALKQINKSSSLDNERPIIFSTIVKPEIRNIFRESKAFVIDFFQAFISPLEQELKIASTHAVGISHAVINPEQYNTRIEAVQFALECDDGLNTNAYGSADLILLGVSRSGKTPTCLYLALQFGLRAANFPLTEDDFNSNVLPDSLSSYRDRLFGLTIKAERLSEIRSKRFPNSSYSSLEQCRRETDAVQEIYKKEKIPYINSTELSIEELSTHILQSMGLSRFLSM